MNSAALGSTLLLSSCLTCPVVGWTFPPGYLSGPLKIAPPPTIDFLHSSHTSTHTHKTFPTKQKAIVTCLVLLMMPALSKPRLEIPELFDGYLHFTCVCSPPTTIPHTPCPQVQYAWQHLEKSPFPEPPAWPKLATASPFLSHATGPQCKLLPVLSARTPILSLLGQKAASDRRPTGRGEAQNMLSGINPPLAQVMR